MIFKGKQIHLLPTQILALGFAAVIIVGAFLLSLPIASNNGESIGIINALFESTSAVCVTGLIVVNTAHDLSLFGQLVIITLIQIGGLGFMTMATMIFLLMGKRITLRERLVMQEALNQFTLQGVVRLTKNVIMTTFLVEGIGALLLSIRFIPLLGWTKGIYFSIFHAISAFCNAGFDLFGNSFVDFTDDGIINLTLMGLIILGGIGFSVMIDVFRNKHHFRKWSLHTKLVILVTGFLIVSGFIFFFLVEYNHTLKPYSMTGKILGALFQAVTPRTAGFNTTPVDELTAASKFFTTILMFIGASPASTGGGIKTVTASIVLLMVGSVIKGRDDVEIFHKRISTATAHRALAIALISLTVLVFVTIILSIFESFEFIDLLFETASALGTVGLATFDNGELTDISKAVIIFAMFAGRVGPLTLTLAFARRQSQNKVAIKYPEDRVMVG